ncbi:SLC13 family permease [Rhodoplanes sp. TEM]|uniref:SLC13 family permease n=1 Tax=Rhodoplanes tepidamans TaxID=200616 RepID=A0ABT5J8J4_RHOTP|nr:MULTISPECIES: SLC13 family permease [Rhodoplanes]MDC7785797.1 SLC13 family permease [Rhodoplanes tepidamans]MDC7984064.1 SLC13 family permease [Rhodoplanes sp. TEM]MDQ0354640.1 di/tricarboxylate transporter [Rhodoplanes tepidamans]
MAAWKSAVVAVPVIALAIAAAVQHAGGGHSLWLAFFVVLATVLMWATRVVPEYLAAFVFFVICAIGLVAPASVFLSGFTGPAAWLVFSGSVIGASLGHTGLADRLGARLAAIANGSFRAVIARVAVFGTALAFLMPSGMGRIFLLAPLLAAFAQRAGLPKGSRGRAGVMLAGLYGTFFPAMGILPANVPNNVLAGLLETTGLGVPSFSEYLLLHFPVIGIAKLALLIGLLTVMFRDVAPVPAPETEPPPPMTTGEKRLTALLVATIGLWLTDSLHGVSATWVGMAAAVVCLWPGTGLLPANPMKSVAFEPIVYVAGVVGLGAVVGHTGLGTRLGELLAGVIAPLAGNAVASYVGLAAIAAGLGPLVTAVGVPAILTPIAPVLATATGLPIATVTMSQVLGFSTIFLPYQAPPLAVAVQIGALPVREAVRACLALALLTILLLWPLDVLWWMLLGRL